MDERKKSQPFKVEYKVSDVTVTEEVAARVTFDGDGHNEENSRSIQDLPTADAWLMPIKQEFIEMLF